MGKGANWPAAGEESKMSIQYLIKVLQEEISQEEKLFQFLDSRSKILPEGSLRVKEYSGRKYYYMHVYLNGQRKYIYLDPYRDEDIEVIKELMEKKTVIHGLPILRDNLKLMRKCAEGLRVYNPMNYRYGELLGGDFYLDEDVCLREWRKIPSEQNKRFQSGRKYMTKSGIPVRSKSEMTIADMLYDLGIEFKYETALDVCGTTVYPDFEIAHPRTHRLVWWEHFGRLYDPVYVGKSFQKTYDYLKVGIRLGENLVITWENEEEPLTRTVVEERLRAYGFI